VSLPWWTRDDLAYSSGRLHLAGHDVAAVAATVDRPLFLYSTDRVTANIARVHRAMASIGQPHRLYFAMKANRFIPLLEHIARGGNCGVDVCSPAEAKLALACGFPAHQVSFTGTAVSNRDLDALLAHPDVVINCDSVGMIRRIGERQPGRPIGLRVNPGVGTGYANSDRLTYAGRITTKFGIYREQWPDALAEARRYKMPVTGLHFHVGCGYLNDQLEPWESAVAASLTFLDDLPQVQTVNVGGGLGVPHRPTDVPLDLERWAAVLRRCFEGRGVTIAAEPGDYLVKDAGLLVLQVVEVEQKRDVLFTMCDGGFNLHPEPAYYDLPCEPVATAPRGSDPADWRPTTVAGNINEALDVWAANHPMPELREGDFVALLNAGGYGAAMSSNHCLRGSFAEICLASSG
jgi:diaminopimelate decarboxylase